MLKIGLVSDLHTEFWNLRERDQIGGAVRDRLADADVILLPGDIGKGADGIAVARSLFPTKPVFIIAGNHEFYQDDYHRDDYDRVLADLQATAGDNIHFLHMRVAEFKAQDVPVRIIGTTLWTDFALYATPELSLFDAQRRLNDFRLIQYNGHTLTPTDTLNWHHEQRSWLLEQLDTAFDGVTIVMTHHAPVSFAISPRFVDDPLTPCFVSRMEELLIRDDLPLVVWGHTHHCVDRTIERTRFVSNQTGYGDETGEFGQIIELASD